MSLSVNPAALPPLGVPRPAHLPAAERGAELQSVRPDPLAQPAEGACSDDDCAPLTIYDFAGRIDGARARRADPAAPQPQGNLLDLTG